MKKLSFTLAALILTSALSLTGRQGTSNTIRKDNSVQQTNGQLESSESDVNSAAAVPSTFEAIPDSEARTTSASYIDLLTALPQGNCPDCDGTGYHSSAVCGTCNGTGFYNCFNEPAEPQGNCPDCDGTGHHSDTVCGTCNGSGWYTVQSHHGCGHHKNRHHH